MTGLNCIIFAEFDINLGHKITFQYPSGFWNEKYFDQTHEYIITKDMLCEHLITLSCFGFKIMSYPVKLENPKYPRNILLWNLCFVFDQNVNTAPYEPIVSKLGLVFKNLELQSEFISNPKTKASIEQILPQIHKLLTEEGEASILLDEANTLYLKLFPQLSPPPEILSHQVPIQIRDLSSLVKEEEWDLTLQQIIPFIDGVNHVKRITQMTGTNIELVKKCLQHLYYYGLIKIIDIFQYSNIYVPTNSLVQLAENLDLQKACCEFITISSGPPLSFQSIFSLYASMHYNFTVRELCQEHEESFATIDPRRFVAFGILNNLIRRVHLYPLHLSSLKKRDRNTEYGVHISSNA